MNDEDIQKELIEKGLSKDDISFLIFFVNKIYLMKNKSINKNGMNDYILPLLKGLQTNYKKYKDILEKLNNIDLS